jgi:CcmD family protein
MAGGNAPGTGQQNGTDPEGVAPISNAAAEFATAAARAKRGLDGIGLGGSMENLFWAYAVVWVLHVGYLVSLAMRQNGLDREIATLKALIEEKSRAPVGQ